MTKQIANTTKMWKADVRHIKKMVTPLEDGDYQLKPNLNSLTLYPTEV